MRHNPPVSDDVQSLTPPDLRRQLADLHPECWGWALACCRGNIRTAEEVLHMSYQKVLDGRARFAGRSTFKTWLFGVIRFTALDERRRSLRHWLRFLPLPNDGDALPAAENTAASASPFAEKHHALRAALAALPARQAEALRLVFYHELTLDEAARVMSVSPGTARTHYERGKAALRARLPHPMAPS